MPFSVSRYFTSPTAGYVGCKRPRLMPAVAALVGVAHDVLMNTFGTARINALVYDVDGVNVYAGKAEDIPLDEEGNALVPIGVQL